MFCINFKRIKNFLLKIHQLPQILIARLIGCRKNEYLYTVDGVQLYYTNTIDGLSLGDTILINKNALEIEKYLIRHEFGHVIQSRILGWLYMPVIFIPSFLWYTLLTKLQKTFGWSEKDSILAYYRFYTESWANKLVGVDVANSLK